MINNDLFEIEKVLTASQLIALMPGNLYWKSVNGDYLGANHTMLQCHQMRSASEIIGKNDYEVLGDNFAEKIIANDKLVLSKLSEQTFHEQAYVPATGKSAIFLSKKVPFYNQDNILIGIMGVSFDVTDKLERSSHENIIDAMSHYFIANPTAPKLSPRQRQCLNFLLCGMTAKGIAARLKLSVRTIEEHIDCIKVKFNCTKKADLINKILAMTIANINN